MTLTVETPRRRPRRIAADEAHAWARNLRLGNPYAKLVLCMLTIYVNGEGSCFVSIAQLAEDCEFAPETVRRRLLWLESVGAIARFPQWRDENGRLNGDGRGKRTTDDIRLLIHNDPDDIEGRAAGDSGPKDGHEEESSTPETAQISHPPRKVGEIVAETVSPPLRTLAAPPLQRGLNDSSEPEPEQVRTPNPLSGGVRGTILDQQSEDSLIGFVAAYPEVITDYPKARAIWAALTSPEQDEAIIGAKGYRSFIEGERKRGGKRAVKDAHRWLRDRLWTGYLKGGHAVEASAERFNAKIDSDEWIEWQDFYRCCGYRTGIPSHLISGDGRMRVANVPRRWPPDIGKNRPSEWTWTFSDGAPQFAAWRRRLHELNPPVRLSGTITVPSEWPPPKSDSTGPPNLVPGTLATESDLDQMAKG